MKFLGATAMILMAAVAAGCDPEPTTGPPVVRPAAAYTAIVEWQAGEQEPVVDDKGKVRLPVIFIVANDGATIDVGVQAEVAASTVDMATVRFADDVADTFDSKLEDEPVRDSGSLLLISPMPEPAPTVVVDLVRYESIDDSQTFQLDVTADAPPDGTDPGTAPFAVVTAVRQP